MSDPSFSTLIRAAGTVDREVPNTHVKLKTTIAAKATVDHRIHFEILIMRKFSSQPRQKDSHIIR